ncbi:unnamed protein product [Gongylonema pulchrum]|uniref:PID domain-containing protein n=1 Tax=Gongylonema pulchrum TaxID=637853 RepID=A0A183EL74_9BILA|nr:unnamed protein product [Gongylonema pulchrum]
MSSDGFQVAGREIDDFKSGKLSLCFFDNHAVSRSKIYTLVESNSYYEMYQHVLEALKLFNDKNKLPFSRYLISGKTDVALPAYLRNSSSRNRGLSHSESSSSLNTVYTESSDSAAEQEPLPPKQISVFGTSYPVDRLKYTLDGDKVAGGLDDAQRNALCYALTHELALIQGPPGTGQPERFINVVGVENFTNLDS